MDWTNNIFFREIANLIGEYICALLIEKGISILQNRPFQQRYAFGIFLIILAVLSLIKGVLFYSP
jgi:hypothetical protein